MKIPRLCLAAAALAVAGACSGSHPVAAPEHRLRLSGTPVNADSTGTVTGDTCPDSTTAVRQECLGRGGMLGSGT